MPKTYRDILIIIFSTILLAFLVWLPYLLRLPNFFGLDFSQGFDTIYRNYDGIEYIVIAKTLYDPVQISALPQSLAAGYYAAHFPGYSLLILALSPFLGFLKSMIFVSLTATAASAVIFYFLVKNFKLTSQPLYLSLLFLVLPARWLIIHSVGSSEPIFIFFTLLSFYFLLSFEKTKRWIDVWLLAIFGSLALLTRPPGILIFIALGIYVLIFKTNFLSLFKKPNPEALSIFQVLKIYFPLLLMPLSLIAIFYWYQVSYNDFFAYFHSGDNIHLGFPPFQIFNKAQYWVGDIWLEDVIYIYILGFLAGLLLIKQGLKSLGIFVLTFMVASILIAHRDISRYIAPIYPFAIIAFQKVLISKEFKIVLAIVLLGIYLYSQNFLLNNTAPIPNIKLFN